MYVVLFLSRYFWKLIVDVSGGCTSSSCKGIVVIGLNDPFDTKMDDFCNGKQISSGSHAFLKKNQDPDKFGYMYACEVEDLFSVTTSTISISEIPLKLTKGKITIPDLNNNEIEIKGRLL